ncbi:TPA: hypothetical protein ACHOY0_001111 [Raoultella ornithinolytica]
MGYKIKVLMVFFIYLLMAHIARGTPLKSSKLEYTTIPLLFGTNMDYQEYSILPPKVTLAPQQIFDEGFSRYILKVKVEKGFIYNKKNDEIIHPIWLSSASDVDIGSLALYHPISKSDLLAIIRNSEITRSQLIDVLRRWDDEIAKK